MMSLASLPRALGRWTAALSLAILLVAVFLAHAAGAQEVDGAWHGALKTPAGALRLVVHIAAGPGGVRTGDLVSVDQGPTPIPLADIQRNDGALTFSVPLIHGRFEGRWDAAAKAWVGSWTQGAAMPLTLLPGDQPADPVIAGLDGDWSGALPTPAGGKLRLIVHIQTGRYGTSASLDSPDQLAKGIRIEGLSRDGQAVRFTAPAVGGTWSGQISADGQVLDGTWMQGASMKLAFTRGAVAGVHSRPQTPKLPFPYRTEEVRVESGPGVTLAGTLSLPPGKGPFPAVVLITGSGAQDRDETLLGHKPFAVIADTLTRRGVAVLRMDDRGFSQSTGDFAKAVTTDFAIDAEAQARFLRARPDIDPRRVGLIGHSEGGLVAPMVAQQDRKIAFVVLMAGPAVPMTQLMDAQRLALAAGLGQSEGAVVKTNLAFAAALEAMAGAEDEADARSRAAAALHAAAPAMPASQVEATARQISSPWFRQLMAYDPRPALRDLRVPVLAVTGSKDRQVPAPQNLPIMREVLKNDRDATIIELPGLNHLFQTAPTGAVGEYEDIDETIAPAALAAIGDWVVAHTR
jgi:pimeloyl-ACP methyl ester carboxylesterase